MAFTALRYHLGEQFSNLNARGTEEIVSLYASYPLIRSRNSNLYAVADLDYRMFQDKVGATSTVVDRAATVLTLGLRVRPGSFNALTKPSDHNAHGCPA